MKILTVDTSGKEIGVGVFEGKKPLYDKYMPAERAYNSRIMPMITDALVSSGVTADKIDIFAAILGPGSFTGIRVGMAVMKAMAHALSKKFTGASSLDVLAASAGAEGRVWAVLEAGRNEVYAAVYSPESGVRSPESRKKTRNPKPETRGKYQLLTREAFIKNLKPGDTVTGLIGQEIMVELAQKSSKIKVEAQEYISLSSLAEIITTGKNIKKQDLYKVEPVYIRLPEAKKQAQMVKRAVHK